MKTSLGPKPSRARHSRPTPWLLLPLLLVGLAMARPGMAQDLPEPGTWRTVADLNQARAGHTATLLANRTVLIAGGKDTSGRAVPLAEIFDASTGQFTATSAAMRTPVWGHTATLLADGTVLITGGRDDSGQPVAAAQLFDPATATFTSLTAMRTPRAAHTATRLVDGRVLIAGGSDGQNTLASLEIYDPTTRTLASVPITLAMPRANHTATLLNNARVLIAGGAGSAGALGSAEIYDPATGTIAPAGALNVPRTLASAALLLDGTVLVAGGQTAGNVDLDSAEIYDPTSRTFALVPGTMSTGRSGHTGLRLPDNGKVILVGGTSGGEVVQTAEVYDPVSPGFWLLNSPATARQLLGANFFADPDIGIFLMSGGLDAAQSPVASAEAFYFPTLRSDKPDYAPGETVTLTGLGWQPHETVTILIHESSGDPDTELVVAADAHGAFTNSDFAVNAADSGVHFLVTAAGYGSGWTAQTTFTDADVRNYSATISPTTDTAGHTSSSYTLTITNQASSTKDLGSARIAVPAGYSSVVIGAVTAPAGKAWSATLVSGVIELRAVNNSSTLAPGETVSVTLTATAPCTAGSYEWTTAAFENRNLGGNQFTLVGAQLSVTITGSCNPTISINDTTVVEGNAGTTNAVFTVTLSAPSTQTVTVNFATADGTATVADNDYQSASGTLTFNPGVTTQTITVLVNGDTKLEPNETFFVNLSSPTNATIGDGQGQGTITNDDAVPTLSINDISQDEGNGVTTAFTFTVTKSGATTQSVTVNFATANGTATGNSNCATASTGTPDFIHTSGSLTFAPNETTKTITVSVCGDATFESNETFEVTLTNASNATISKATGTGTIQNDDGAATLAINDVSQDEGSGVTTAFTFTVTKSGATTQSVTVNYATANGTATGNSNCSTAATGTPDFIHTSGTLTFGPSETTKTITVSVCGDLTFELNETFLVNLSNASNATITKGTGTGTIQNDDGAATLAINDVSQDEGSAGTTAFTFTVTKSGATTQSVTVNYATANGTATGNSSCSTAGTGTPDFIHASGTLTFGPSETTKTITVEVCGDVTFEPSETFLVNLSNASNATITKGTGTGTIQNDDAAPTLSIDDVTQNEGNVGTTNFVFTVTKTGATTQSATVQFATANGTATGNSTCAAAATGTPDFLSTSGTLTFAANETTKTITVEVCGDMTFELSETFLVNLSNASNATIFKGTGTGTIQNDDAAPTVAINDVTQNEGNSTTTTDFTFTVTKTGASALPSTVAYTTMNGTTNGAIGGATCVGPATGSPDYITQAGVLTFGAGETTKTITVAVCGDATFEATETFFVKLSAPTNATITRDQGTGTITNDDAMPSLSINDVPQAEGDAGMTPFVFTVTLNGASALPATVNFATANGTATGNTDCATAATGTPDFIHTSGPLVFAPGETIKMIPVQVCGDNRVESAETFFVNLSSATNAMINDGQGQGTIQNDDFAPVISSIVVTPEPSREGEEVTVTATFSDNDDAAGFTCTVNFGDGTTLAGVVAPSLGGGFTCTSKHVYLDDGPSPGNGTPQDTYTITVTVTDPGGNPAMATANHVVQNVAPSITLIAATPNPVASGTPVTVTASFTDAGTLDAHTCTINWGDGTTTSGTVSPPTGSGTCTGTHTYTAGGVLTITVTVTDDDGGSDTDTAFVTLIGLSEKVTGGGWIKQPAGAVPNNGGMAYFGFNAKQHVGDTVPTGETNFKYRPGNLHFHSTSYEALIVTITPDPLTPDKAEWWGSGTINGSGDYCFKVNVTDAGEPGSDDSIRMRIWQKVIGTTTCAVPAAAPPLLLYDNGFPTQSETTLGGGNIKMHP